MSRELQQDYSKLVTAWMDSRYSWNDTARQKFDNIITNELDRHLQSLLRLMIETDQFLDKIQHDINTLVEKSYLL